MEITKENIEAVLYDYAEGNLSAEEMKQTEDFLALHPQYKQWLAMYKESTALPQPLDIVYKEKQELFARSVKTKGAKIVKISRYIKYISGIAAMIALFLAVRTYYTLQNTQTTTDKTQTAQLISEIKTAESENAPATSHFSSKNTRYFHSKNPVFSLKKPGIFNSETASGENESTFGLNQEDFSSVTAMNGEEENITDNPNELNAIALNKETNEINVNNTKEEIMSETTQPTGYYLVTKEQKPQRDGYIRRKVNSALSTDAAQSAVDAVVQVITNPVTKKLVNTLTGRKAKRNEVIQRQVTATQEANV
ncbi:MAG: hypothetical protein J6M30_07790 [Bacteroidales bacterium]|nr:hypothetical protein [Bacteroidales bacterium]